MGLTLGELEFRALRQVGQAYLRAVKATVASRAISESLTLTLQPGEVTLRTPYYWAKLYHDGRGPINMPKGRFMIFFKDPVLDPRLRGGRPVRTAQVRRLTPAEFREAQASGALIIARHVGPQKGTHFFTKPIAQFRRAVPRFLKPELDAWAKTLFADAKLGGNLNVTLFG